MNKHKTIQSLIKLKEKLPELAKKDSDTKFWESFHPYTIEDAVVLLKIKNVVEIKKQAEELTSSWNGQDEKFIHEGSVYNEDHVSCAEDIIKKCDELQELLNEMEE